MHSRIAVLLVALASGNLPGAFAQDTATQSGFAVVTLMSGNVAGLIATERLINRTSAGIEQAIVAPSVLVTSASLLVPIDPVGDNTTAIAVANPSMGSGGINLLLTDELGGVVLNVTLHIGPRGHFAKFLNEFFATQPSGFPTPLLLTISAELPVAILAINFRAGEFTPIPLTRLSLFTPVPLQPMTPSPARTSAQPGFGLGLPPGTLPPGAQQGFGLGVARGTTPAAPTLFPAIVTTSPVPRTESIGGSGSLIFAEVAAGGGWVTEIAIGNISSATQLVRIDFFGTDGVHIRSLTGVIIPPGGVFFFSTDTTGTAIQ